MRNQDKILGTLYGQAIGDAMGMPTELWPVERIRQTFGQHITTFLAGTPDNVVARYYQAGEYTDDTAQAFAILDALIATNWQPDQQVIAEHLLRWADHADAWHRNILGPSTKQALRLIQANQAPDAVTQHALTNGCGMRIAPIGACYTPEALDQLVAMVAQITRVTHASDVAISGAAMIAGAVTAAIADYTWDDIIQFAMQASAKGHLLGAPTWAANNNARLRIGINLAQKYVHDDQRFSTAIYTTVGTGTMVSESIPAAVAIAYYAQNVEKCAYICTNLGGDTDTIGAMATAICGAKYGFSSIPQQWVTCIDERNPDHDIRALAAQISQFQAQPHTQKEKKQNHDSRY